MQTRFTRALAACTLIVLSVPALAQTPAPNQPPVRRVAAPRQTQAERDYQAVVFLPPDELDAIAPLQPDQKTKITAIRNDMREQVKAANRDRAKIADIRAHAMVAIREVLAPDQNRQIEHVMAAVGWLNRTRAVPAPTLKEVNLTRDQWEQIVTIQAEEYAKVKGENMDQRKATLGEFKSRVDAILTDAQKQVVAKFDAAHPPRTAPTAPRT